MTINSIGKEIGLAAVNILPLCAGAALFGNPVGVAGAAIYGSVGYATRRGCFFLATYSKDPSRSKGLIHCLACSLLGGVTGYAVAKLAGVNITCISLIHLYCEAILVGAVVLSTAVIAAFRFGFIDKWLANSEVIKSLKAPVEEVVS